MKAFQFVAWQKPPSLRDVPVPEPGPGEVLVKIGGAGACHSDLHQMEAHAGSKPFKVPITLGHENAGRVEKLGPGATGFKRVDPVIVYGPWGCGLCMNCRAGKENYCQNLGNMRPGVEHFPLARAERGLPAPARRQDPWTRGHHTND